MRNFKDAIELETLQRVVETGKIALDGEKYVVIPAREYAELHAQLLLNAEEIKNWNIWWNTFSDNTPKGD